MCQRPCCLLAALVGALAHWRRGGPVHWLLAGAVLEAALLAGAVLAGCGTGWCGAGSAGSAGAGGFVVISTKLAAYGFDRTLMNFAPLWLGSPFRRYDVRTVLGSFRLPR